MGIFNFFKKAVKERGTKEIAPEKLAFSEIESWLEKRRIENEFKEKDILFGVEKKIEKFIKELREKIIILRGFDVETRKDKERVKNIVINSREKYIESVEELIEKLNNLEELKLEKFIEKINKIFFHFNKGSFKNYEMATILIGKEMASVKDGLKVFSRDLLKIFDESKPITDSFKNFRIIKEKLDSININNKILEGINEKKLNLNKKINEEEEENRILKQSLERIKSNPAYLENLAKQKKIKSLREESKKDILELRQFIDFKALTNFFHIFEEQMKMVKNHRENFYIFFLKDNGKSLMSLLKEAKLNNDKILEKIRKIHSKLEEIANNEKNLKGDGTQEIYFKIKEIHFEIDNLKIEKIKEEKREDTLRVNKEELTNSLNQEFSRMNVEVI